MGAEVRPEPINNLGAALALEGLSVREIVLKQLDVLWLGPYELAIFLDKSSVRVFFFLPWTTWLWSIPGTLR